jgi:hypothetical protein
LVRIGPTAWPFTGFIHTYIHTDRQLDKYILDHIPNSKSLDELKNLTKTGSTNKHALEINRVDA